MPICPSGHDSGSGDYCDVCGLAISSGPASAAAPANSAATAPGTAGSGPVSGPAQISREIGRVMTQTLRGVEIATDPEVGGRSWGSLYE